jgi:hypothetical protein
VSADEILLRLIAVPACSLVTGCLMWIVQALRELKHELILERARNEYLTERLIVALRATPEWLQSVEPDPNPRAWESRGNSRSYR